jgi:hypothetical protein
MSQFENAEIFHAFHVLSLQKKDHEHATTARVRKG